MPDDWSWFWAGESGRDNLLRDEIEGLQSRASAASAQSARLSSQLRTLQGSIESRLQALSTAFDAYVELGDVREQLAGYPDTSAVRRDVLKALVVLEQGGVPEPVDGRGAGYWLVDAANEVVALASGTPPARGDGATGTTQEHETFVVAALGWLGHGELVAGRVAPLLVNDGALAAPQVVLWRAVVHGLYGDALETVGESWRGDLDLAAPVWDRFASEAADAAGPVGTLTWVQDLLLDRWSPAPEAAGADDRGALRTVVDALVGAGLGDERALLERSRVLRARIENPGSREADPQAEPPRTPTTDLVQEAVLDPGVPAAIRSLLVTWVRPGLQAAAAGVAATVAVNQPGPTVVHTELGDVGVGTDGPDPQRVAELDTFAVQRWTPARSRLLVPGVAAAVVLVLGLVLLATRAAGLGVFLIVVAAVLAVVAARELLRARTMRAELEGARERTRTRIEEGRAVATSVRAASLETKAQVAGLARAISEVGAPVETSLR